MSEEEVNDDEGASDLDSYRASREGKKRSKDFAARIVRQNVRGRKKEACFICGKHQYLTVLHHIAPVCGMESIYDWKYKSICEATVVSLCPNHHAIVHLLGIYNWGSFYEYFDDVEKEGLGRLHERTRRVAEALRLWGAVVPEGMVWSWRC